MENALIIGASGGIGSAIARTLQARGVATTGLSRRVDGLDVRNETSVAANLGAVEGPFDLICIATGALEIAGARPEKTIRAVSARAMLDHFSVNTVGPALVLGHAARLLPRDRRAVCAVLSARVGSIKDNRLGGWVSYRSAKAAVNQVVRCAAIELARTHKQAAVVSLHPGTVATQFTEKYLGRHPAVSPDEAAQNLLRVIDGLTPDQTGHFLDWSGVELPW
ncbi:MAG: SDR family NAD(P)-dependent oxidoreductase [Rhodobacteraceae bacterium]|nr:SDR family NAD(P)-dependent oxidoreductase [Paracoccaceae bacterium]